VEAAGLLSHFVCTGKRTFLESSLLRSELQQHGASVPVRGSLRHTLLAEPQGCCSTRARSRPSLIEGRLFH